MHSTVAVYATQFSLLAQPAPASYVHTYMLPMTHISCVQTCCRLFSVVKYESVIHEFDPYFNYRVTQFLTKEGFYDMWNWWVVLAMTANDSCSRGS
jgi:hypothetical protein